MANRPERKPLLSITPSGVSELLYLVYYGAVVEGRSRNFIEQCCRHINAIAGVIAIFDARTQYWHYLDLFPNVAVTAEEYQGKLAHKDPINKALFSNPPGRFYTRSELLSRDEIERDPYVAEWRDMHSYDEFCGARVQIAGHYDCVLSFVRRIGQRAFTRRELDLLDMLLPHIQLAITQHSVIDRLSVFADITQQQSLLAGYGLVAVNDRARTVHMNRVAAQMLEQGAVVRLGQDNTLLLAEPGDQVRLDALLLECINVSRTRGVLVGRSMSMGREGRPPVSITVSPYRREMGLQTYRSDNSRALVTIHDPERPRLDTRVLLREMYSLTEAEAEVCWRIGNGEALGEIAQATGIALETVRSQVKRVFAKTGVNRQADLVRLVLTGPSFWGPLG